MKPIHLLSLICFVTACSPSDKKDPILEEAAQYHNEAIKIQALVEPQIKQIDSLTTRLNKQPAPRSLALVTTLDSLKKAFEHWETNLVEVPGMPHDHAHEHGDHQHHHHADTTLKDLPADQMRDLQKSTRDNIRLIQERTEAVFAQTTSLLN